MEKKVSFKKRIFLLAVSLILVISQTGCAQIEPRVLAFYERVTGNHSLPESHFQFETALQFEIVEVETIPLTTEQKTRLNEAQKNQTNQITAMFDGQTLPSYFSEAVQYWWCLGKIQYWADNAYQKYNVTAVTKAEFRLGLATVVQIESAGYPLARSRSDARGLGQVMPKHFKKINPNITYEETLDPDTNLERASWHFSEEGVNRAAAKGYTGFEALVQAARGYNGGAGVIGKASLKKETDNYEMYFRGFMVGNMEVINLWFSYAVSLTDSASAWLATQPACQTQPTAVSVSPIASKAQTTFSVSETITWEKAEQTLDQFVGFSYKDFGYIYYPEGTNEAKWCTWKGGDPVIDNLPGFNCGGFVLQATRTFCGQVTLGQIFTVRTDRVDPSGSDRSWFGYDLLMNLLDLPFIDGQVLKIEGLDWQEGSGFLVADWVKVGQYLKKGYFYLASINKPDSVAGRKHHHVAVILPTDDGIWVYEATDYLGSGVIKISLEDFQKKYQALNFEYRMWVVEVEIS